jgi:hypothetical protein
VTLWDNSEQVLKHLCASLCFAVYKLTPCLFLVSRQVKSEASDISIKPDRRHPAVSETRWRLDGNLVEGGPAGWLFAMLEIGDSFFCALDSCEFTLFGLETVAGTSDVLLHSYTTNGNKAAGDAIRSLHRNHHVTSPVIKFTDMEEDAVRIVYKYGFNATVNAVVFYGQGGGALPSGGRIEVFETVAPGYVAPLENFYGADGTKYTPYDTPVVYRRIDKKTEAQIIARNSRVEMY